MTKVQAVGIDLGTTNTIVAVANPAGHTEILRTREGESLVPSAVLLADDRTVVGREAVLRGRLHPDRLAACSKRQLGQPFYDQRIGGESLSPEVIQACILQAVRREWFAKESGNCSVVIAVPAHFNESQRYAVATAAEMSGLSLLDLVNEPIAAALAFAEHTPALEAAPRDQQPHAVLVYDLGGYTFEATILWISPGHVTMVASEHDSFLGGHDWDLRLADFLAEPFIRKHGVDPRTEPLLLEQFIQRACQVKLALGVRARTELGLTCLGHSEKVQVTRQQFEGMTADLLERTMQICDAALRRAELKWSDVQHVLLVGGATRMPMIRDRLAKRSGRQPDDRVCPEEAVARGAAIYAARIKQGLAGAPPLHVTSVSTHSLGIEGTDQCTGERINKVLIPKGTPLPAAATREFMSKSHLGKIIAFNVLEGEHSHPSKCVTIGRVILCDLPADIADQWPVEVKYEYSASGRLAVDARVRYTDRNVHLETVRPGGVSQAHIARWKDVVTGQAGLAAYRQVRAWERAADATPPLVVAGIESTPQEVDDDPRAGGVRSFLQRMLPFVFRPSRGSPTDTSAIRTTSSDTAPDLPFEARKPARASVSR